MQEERIRNRLSDTDFREMVSSLNQKQSEFLPVLTGSVGQHPLLVGGCWPQN